MEKVQPANRSSLTSCKNQSATLTCSNELICNEKKLLISAGKALQYQNNRTTNIPGDSVLDENSFKGLLTPCPSKKRKSIGTKLEVMRHDESYSDYSSRLRNSESNSSSSKSMECENGHDSANRSSQSAQVRNEETRGSDFLIQVSCFNIICNFALNQSHHIKIKIR